MIYNCFCKNFIKGIFRLIVISIVLFLIVSLISCGEGADQHIKISKQEIGSDYKIVVLGNSKEEKFAGNILEKYLKLSTESSIRTLSKPEKDILDDKYIIVGLLKNKYIKKTLGLDYRLKEKQSFLITKFDDDILILARSPIGAVYGVNHFLEKYVGIRFLSKDFTYIPEDIEIDIEPYADIQVPQFEYREIFIKESDDPAFALKLKLNGRLGHRNKKPLKYGNIYVKLHNIYDLVPPKIYKKKHPEFFCKGQLDFTNPAVKKIALKRAKKILKKYKKINKKFYFVISNNDHGFYCKNKRSRKRIKQGKSPSTPYLDFVVYLAENLKDKYPNAIFTASAYLWSRKPPKNYQKLPDNMAIFFSDIEADFSKPIYHKKNKEIFSDLKGWTKLTDHILIWHYITNFNNYFQPYPNIYTVAENIKTYSKIKQIKGVFLQGSYGTLYGDMSDLKLYVFSRLLWNPDQDVKILIDDFLDKFYADASLYIKRYIKLLYKHARKNPYPLKAKMIQNAPYLNAEFFINAEKLLENALKVVPEGSIFEKNVKKIKFGVDLMLLVNKPYLIREAKEKNLPWFDDTYIQKIRKDVKRFIKSNKIKFYAEGGKIKNLLTLIKTDRDKVVYPRQTRGLVYGKDWLDYQEYTLQTCCGAKFEYDKKASDKIAVSMSGRKTVWGIKLNLDFLPEGKWKIFFSIRVLPSKKYSPEAVAFRYGVYPKTKPKKVKLIEMQDKKYHIIKVGTFKRSDGYLWIAPPGNGSVKKIYVDRVFIIRD